MPLNNRRIGLLTASASRAGGGVFEAVVAQVQLIAGQGGIPVVFALDDEHGQEDRHRLDPAEVHRVRVVGPRQIGFAPELVRRLTDAALDCLHLHGIWMYPSAAGAAWARITGGPYVVSPHGMLDPWITARGRWKKALARVGYERRSWRAATALHALTTRERDDIACETGRPDAVVIPNAGPLAITAPRTPPGPDIVYIGRIHPKKNLAPLIAAWGTVDRPAAARLLIAGWGDAAAVHDLEQQIATAGPSVRFLGPVFGEEKQALLSGARFVVLPSLSEGLPMAVLEAWSLGIPVLMTRECNLPEGIAAGAALDCGYSKETIATALHQAFAADDAHWAQMSRAAADLADQRFSPPRIAEQWTRTYLAALGPANRAGLIQAAGQPLTA